MDTFVHDPLVDWTRGSSGSRGGGGDEGGDNPQAKDALATIEGGEPVLSSLLADGVRPGWWRMLHVEWRCSARVQLA